jgi:hypothetical protein
VVVVDEAGGCLLGDFGDFASNGHNAGHQSESHLRHQYLINTSKVCLMCVTRETAWITSMRSSVLAKEPWVEGTDCEARAVEARLFRAKPKHYQNRKIQLSYLRSCISV